MPRLPKGLKASWLYRLTPNERISEAYPAIGRYRDCAVRLLGYSRHEPYPLHVSCSSGGDAYITLAELGQPLGKDVTPTLQQRAMLAAARSGCWFGDLKAAKMVAGGSGDSMAMLVAISAMGDWSTATRMREVSKAYAKRMGWRKKGGPYGDGPNAKITVERPFHRHNWLHRERLPYTGPSRPGRRLAWFYTLTPLGQAALAMAGG